MPLQSIKSLSTDLANDLSKSLSDDLSKSPGGRPGERPQRGVDDRAQQEPFEQPAELERRRLTSYPSSSSRDFASVRSGVSKPSVNQA